MTSAGTEQACGRDEAPTAAPPGADAATTTTAPPDHDAPPAHVRDFALERYRYILQQIHSTNENVYRFLAIYQALATAAVGAALVLFVNYRRWGIAAATARSGVLGLMWLETVVAAFTVLLIVVGILNWLDYRNEECDLTDQVVHAAFRKRPRVGNLFRWYETYIVVFIAASTGFMWLYALTVVLPAMT